MKIHIAHSPDADDAFMFSPLFEGKVSQEGFELVDVREDIETLNKKALEGSYEATAVSIHAFPYIAERYRLLSTGACFGEKYGPILVTKKPLKAKQLLKVRVAIPGKMTTAFLALRLYEHYLAGEGKSGICYSEVPFDKIMDQVIEGKVDAGLIIHEGQLNYAEKGLHKAVDLGEWWYKQTKLPLPLGGIAIRRDLPLDVQVKVGKAIQSSIRYALDHKEEVLQKALPYARGLDPERALQFILMYVNDMTYECGRPGYKAIKTILEKGSQSGIIRAQVDLEDAFLNLRKPSPSSEPSLDEPPSSTPSRDIETTTPSSDPGVA